MEILVRNFRGPAFEDLSLVRFMTRSLDSKTLAKMSVSQISNT